MEQAPTISAQALSEALLREHDEQTEALIDRINERFEYWDKVKYKPCPEGLSAAGLWTLVKASRLKVRMDVWKRYGVTLSFTNGMQRLCHEFDMNWSGLREGNPLTTEASKQRCQTSSLMEEAIYSSQMEGAATTRKVAKDMLRRKASPKDKSQQMIANNYATICFVVEHRDDDLTPQLLQQVHRLMTARTMPNADDAGRFRRSNDVVVENGITHETVHTPPSFEEIPGFVDDLCRFFNDRQPARFIHPIIRAIIIHFMVAYVHPFVDGNGRTSRALFYWYMLRQGYWLTEYLSISRIIASSKKAYEKAFLYTEADGNDMGYFVTYHLNVLEQSFAQLCDYLQRQQEEKDSASRFMRLGNVNERQSEILQFVDTHPGTLFTVADMAARFAVSPTTAKSDITVLVNRGLLEEIAINKVKRGYMRGPRFGDI